MSSLSFGGGGQELGLSILIRAEDEATQQLARVEQAVQSSVRGMERAGSTAQNMGAAFRQAGTGVRSLAVPLVSELSPALGTTGGRMASIIASAAIMPGALGAVGLAAGGLAAVLGGQLLGAWQRNREEAESFQRAMASIDGGVVARELGKARQAADEAAGAFARLRSERLQGQGLPGFGAPGAGPDAGVGLRVARSAEERARQDAIGILDRERALADWSKALKDGDDELRALATSEALLNKASADAWAKRREEAEKFAATVARLRREDREASFSAAAAATAGEALAFGDPRDPLFLAGQREISERILAQQSRARLAAREATDLASAAFADESAAFGPVNDAAYRARLEAVTAKIAADELAGRRALLAVEQDRLAILDRIPGLSAEARAETELRLSLERESLRVQELDLLIEGEKDERLKEALTKRRELVQQEEELLRLQVRRTELERTDPAFGLGAGFRQVAEEWEAAGLVMQDVAVRTATTVRSTFSDLLFSPLVGDFDNVAKRLGLSFARIFTDAIAENLTGRLSRTIANLLPGGGVTPGPFASGSTGAINLTGASPAALAQLAASGVRVVQSGAESFALLPAAAAYTYPPGSPDAQYLAGRLLGDATLPGGAAEANAQAAAARLMGIPVGPYATAPPALTGGYPAGAMINPYGLSWWDTPVFGPHDPGGLHERTGPTAGVTSYGDVAGYAGVAVASAALIYSGTQRRSEPDPVSSLGNLVGFATTGNPIALAGFVAGLFDTGANNRRRERRRQRRAAAAVGIVNDLGDAVNGVYEVRELVGRPVRGTSNTVGGLLAAIAAMNVAGQLAGAPVSWPPSDSAQEALSLLLDAGARPEDLRPSTVILGVTPNEAPDDLEALRNPLHEDRERIVQLRSLREGGLRGLLEAAPAGIGDTLESIMAALVDRVEATRQLLQAFPVRVDEGGEYVARTTETSLLAVERYYPESRGAPLQVPSEQLARDLLHGASDEDIAYLYRRLHRVVQERDLIQWDQPSMLFPEESR